MTVAKESPVVTVVVVTHRAAGFIGACLRGLAEQTIPHRLLVIDNASTDGTADILDEVIRRGDPLRSVLRLDSNEGFAGAVAGVLAQIDTPFLALLNDDAVPDPDWLEALLAVALLDPLGAAWTSLVVLKDDPAVVNNLGTGLNASWYGVDLDAGSLVDAVGDDVRNVTGFCGGAALLRTGTLRSVGGIPAEFFMYYEDLDTSLRLQAVGWQIRAVPTARVVHRHAATSDVRSRNFHLWNERNRLLMLARRAPLSVAPRQLTRFLATTASIVRSRVLRRSVPEIANFDPRLRMRVVAEVIAGMPRAYLHRATWRRRLRAGDSTPPPTASAANVRLLTQSHRQRQVATHRRAV